MGYIRGGYSAIAAVTSKDEGLPIYDMCTSSRCHLVRLDSPCEGVGAAWPGQIRRRG